ncbi:hypothetical protein [Paenibacillus bovis]|uniref:Lipoprotein n=1 Tax=Paenibacillus bovis TaxID=1616788 RepID=A0A172ZCU5_9BACL|nr:hypothetical protein [Paenibacillus bovis]ANF95474.1 hypothetical protein AR543_05245 [Paenibacillus bovis]
MKKYTLLLLTLVMSTSLLGCTQQSSKPASNNEPAGASGTEAAATTTTTAPAATTSEPAAAGKQGDTVNEEQLKAAIEVAKKYKETEYTVPDYTSLDLEFEIPKKTTDPVKLPPSMQQQYDNLLQYATQTAMDNSLRNRLIDLPLQLAVKEKSPISPQHLEFHADPVLKVKGILEIDYTMKVQLDRTKEQLPLQGTVQLQQIDGTWKVINDKYDSDDRNKLFTRRTPISKP